LVNIFLWDATTCKQIGPPINKLHRRAVRQLAFSNDGKYLLSIGEDDNHTMGIYDVESRKLLGDAKVDLDKVLDAQWN
jgi:WD40 repeat protein